MNKIKFIPVLTLTALLAGCNLFGGKAPKFADSGEEVEYSYFYDKSRDEIFNGEIYDTEVKFTDRVVKYSSYEMNKSVTTRDRKEISKTEMAINRKGETQYDVDNAVAKLTSEGKSVYKANADEGNASYNITEKTEGFYQFEKESGTRFLVYANTKTKEYTRNEQVSSSRKQDQIFDDLIRNDLYGLVNQFNMYVPGSSSEAKDYLFYIKDDSLFTLTVTKEDTTKASEYNLVTKTKLKVQLNTTDSKQSLKVSNEVQRDYTYTKDYLSNRKGDVRTENVINYFDYTFTGKNVNLSNVNVDDYFLRS